MAKRAHRTRPADTDFSASAEVHPFWQDLTEAGGLKLREVLKYAARGEAVLWRTEFDQDAFWKRSGQMIPFYYMEVCVSPARLHISEPVTVTHTRRFGKQVDADGHVLRLVSHGDTTLEGIGDDGGPFLAARLTNYGFFVRRSGPRDKRRVKRLHPSLHLSPVPKRVLPVPGVDDLRTPPTGWDVAPMAGRFRQTRDAESQIWTVSDTDGNGHVHSMAYVGRAEDFAMQALGRREIRVARYFPASAKLLFRRPCNNGELYIRAGQFFRAPARDAYLFVGAFYPVDSSRDDGDLGERPSVLVQCEIARRPLPPHDRP